MRSGKHVLVHIPRGAAFASTLLHVVAEARQLGARCGDMYFQELNVTGALAEIEQAGGFRFRVEDGGCEGKPILLTLGKVILKVVRGCTPFGARYFNFYVQHLGSMGVPVGGLLGDDDHKIEGTPSQACGHSASLEGRRTSHVKTVRSRSDSSTGVAIGSLAEGSLW